MAESSTGTVCHLLSVRLTVLIHSVLRAKWVILQCMKSQVAAIFLGLTFLSTVIHDSSWYFHYLLHQEEISDLFCINKAEPELQCNGKCHLKKQLQISDDKEQHEPATFELNQLILAMPVETANSKVIPISGLKQLFSDFNFFSTDPLLLTDTPPPRYRD